jgi:hypothetical protein
MLEIGIALIIVTIPTKIFIRPEIQQRIETIRSLIKEDPNLRKIVEERLIGQSYHFNAPLRLALKKRVGP